MIPYKNLLLPKASLNEAEKQELERKYMEEPSLTPEEWAQLLKVLEKNLYESLLYWYPKENIDEAFATVGPLSIGKEKNLDEEWQKHRDNIHTFLENKSQRREDARQECLESMKEEIRKKFMEF